MLEDPMVDLMGTLISELRADADVASLVSTRVRGGEPAKGDARDPGQYQAFIVLTALSQPPHPRVPVIFGTYGVRCYGATFQNATAVWGAVAKALHRVGARVTPGGTGIYISAVESGGEQLRDPDTGQPYVSGTISVVAAAQAVT